MQTALSDLATSRLRLISTWTTEKLYIVPVTTALGLLATRGREKLNNIERSAERVVQINSLSLRSGMKLRTSSQPEKDVIFEMSRADHSNNRPDYSTRWDDRSKRRRLLVVALSISFLLISHHRDCKLIRIPYGLL